MLVAFVQRNPRSFPEEKEERKENTMTRKLDEVPRTASLTEKSDFCSQTGQKAVLPYHLLIWGSINVETDPKDYVNKCPDHI